MQVSTGFWASKTLFSAVEFGLFTTLAEKGPQTAMALKKEMGLGCSDRHVYDFLDALTALGFLQRDGIFDTATYGNTPDTEMFLDKNKPSYIGGMVTMLNHRLYGFWGDLEEGLHTGCPQNEAKCGDNLFAAIYSDPQRLEEFIFAMMGVQMGNFMAFSQKFDFSDRHSLVDVGGSSGILSLLVAKDHPHMQCTTWDLPPVQPIAQKTIEKFGLQQRVRATSGDFFKDPIPSADILVMGNILHDWDEETKLMLMQKAYDALPEGGCFVAIENVIDEDRNQNVMGLLMSLNMLIETGSGFDYTFGDFRGWAGQIGFRSTSLLPLAGPASAALAFK